VSRAKIAITVDEEALTEIDPLARESAKLDRTEEQAFADEVYAGEAEWPEYTAKLNEVYATEASALDPVLQSIQSRSVK
jgi:hypothetical protein